MALTRAAVMEYARQNILINGMCPSFVGTPQAQDYPEQVQKAFAFQPLGCMGKTDEIASGVLCLWTADTSPSRAKQ